MVRRQLGAELRRLRERTGRTSVDVARELGWSDSKLSRIETARIAVSTEDLNRLGEAYRAEQATCLRLHELNRQGRQRVWWEGYRDVLLDQYEAYIAYETEAAAIYEYNAMVVPGLLQTDEYARTVTEVDNLPADPEVTAQRVAVRMARQAILSRQPSPEVRVILDEAVIWREIGGPNVMRRQLSQLVAQGQRENIAVQVVRFRAGAHRGIGGNFVLLDLPTEKGEPLVYCDGMTGGVIRSKKDEVSAYRDAFKAISRVALSPADSMNFLTEAASQMVNQQKQER